jgi:D-xylose transport system substrate-binding protein
MKTKFLFPFILLILCNLTSCKKQVEIGFLMDNFKQERWSKDRDLFIQRAKELGGKVILQVAEGDAANQIQQARELLQEKVDILVVVPVDQFSAANIVGMAHKYKVKVISYDRLIRNCDLDLYISFDNIEVGRLQADYLTKVCPKGRFALIGGATNDNNSSLIKLGQMNILQPLIERGDIELVYDQFVDKWSQEEGYKHMVKCLEASNKRVDAVLSANDDLATGVIKALDEVKLAGKVYLAGQDADLAACQRIVSGTQTMTVYKPIEAIAYKAAEVAIRMARGEVFGNSTPSVNNGKMMVPSILLPPMSVNKETIKLTVVADGYLQENNIFTKESSKKK